MKGTDSLGALAERFLAAVPTFIDQSPRLPGKSPGNQTVDQ